MRVGTIEFLLTVQNLQIPDILEANILGLDAHPWKMPSLVNIGLGIAAANIFTYGMFATERNVMS